MSATMDKALCQHDVALDNELDASRDEDDSLVCQF